MYALVDCNNFYVSCERVFQPQYNNKPVVVLSNNDGCVISRSSEAKALGIPMGIPEFKIKEFIQQQNIKVFSSNYVLYGDLSQRVMKILENFTPNVEMYSIDEAFLNFDGQQTADYHSLGLNIQQRISKWLSIPTGIGFAPTKALAKLANRIAKKFPERTNGVYVIDTEEKRIKALKWTKIADVWGIGYRLTKKMQRKNILTAYDFTLPHNEPFIKKEMGVVGIRLKYELEGKSILEINEPKTKRTIAITRSFEHDINDYNELKEFRACKSCERDDKLSVLNGSRSKVKLRKFLLSDESKKLQIYLLFGMILFAIIRHGVMDVRQERFYNHFEELSK